MAEQKIHIGDIGTVFNVTLTEGVDILDISTATELYVIFGKPDSTSIEVSASFQTDGSNGVLIFLTTGAELDMVGMWKIQARVVMPAWAGYSGIAEFEVFPNL